MSSWALGKVTSTTGNTRQSPVSTYQEQYCTSICVALTRPPNTSTSTVDFITRTKRSGKVRRKVLQERRRAFLQNPHFHFDLVDATRINVQQRCLVFAFIFFWMSSLPQPSGDFLLGSLHRTHYGSL